MTYNPNIHHRRSIRLQGYDYSKAGAYFVTLCVHGGWSNHEGMTGATNELWLGKIVEGHMELNDYGLIMQERWLFIPQHYQDVELDEFVIMPNHFHGIVVLGDSPAVSLSKMIQDFKTYSAIRINKRRQKKGVPVWQRNYYEHIIRNEQDLTRIRIYILNNPAKWMEDTYYRA